SPLHSCPISFYSYGDHIVLPSFPTRRSSDLNETGVIGCMVMSVELSSRGGQKKRKNFSAKYNFEDIITRNKTFLASFDVLRKLRSEEHTSELQSRFDLVCRLLLEKKNKKTTI